MVKAFFILVVIPVMMMRVAVMYCATTRSNKMLNWFKEMTSRMRSGTNKTLFRNLEYSFVCNACRILGKSTTCKHYVAQLPPWQSAEKHEDIRALLGPEDKADLERETMGIEETDKPTCFPESKVRQWFAKPLIPCPVEYTIPHVFVCLDPNNGSKNAAAGKFGSDYAVVSGYQSFTSFVVTGLESIGYRHGDDYRKPVLDHFVRLQSRPGMYDSVFVVMIENNGSREAQWMAELLTDAGAHGIRNVVMMNHDATMKDGLTTTHKIKADMMEMMYEMISRGLLAFDSQLVSSSPVKEIKEEFLKQTLAYSEVKRVSTDPLAPVVRGYTGKITTGAKDDMMMAMQLNNYWRAVFLSSPTYALYNSRR